MRRQVHHTKKATAQFVSRCVLLHCKLAGWRNALLFATAAWQGLGCCQEQAFLALMLPSCQTPAVRGRFSSSSFNTSAEYVLIFCFQASRQSDIIFSFEVLSHSAIWARWASSLAFLAAAYFFLRAASSCGGPLTRVRRPCCGVFTASKKNASSSFCPSSMMNCSSEIWRRSPFGRPMSASDSWLLADRPLSSPAPRTAPLQQAGATPHQLSVEPFAILLLQSCFAKSVATALVEI